MRQKPAPACRRRSRLTALMLLLCLMVWLVCREVPLPAESHGSMGGRTADALAHRSQTPPVEGRDCRACHAEIVSEWERSQHAMANRLLPAVNLLPGESRYGDVHTRIGADLALRQTVGQAVPFVGSPRAVIAVEPLVQLLVEHSEGRWQVFNPAYHTQTQTWFNVFDEVRRPGEWGHWTGRAMNWNSRCAWCHMTGFQKRYDPATDRYDSDWQAMGIACAQCHADQTAHAANPEKVSALRLDRKAAQENCMSCHARREFLSAEGFHAGAPFDAHFRLALFDQPGVYFPDGQVQDENFEATSFRSSRMYDAGVNCLDCHNPHSGRLVLPIENNALCMSCHTPPGRLNAPPITPTAHSHHAQGSTGNLCVECHMPKTTYMQVDARRDHGFTSPDPLLTRELGIPNACNRCHQDRSVDWAIGHSEAWYGPQLQARGGRERTRLVAAARDGDPTIGSDLARRAGVESNAVWRASLLALLRSYTDTDEARDLLRQGLTDPRPLVRAAAVQSLGAQPAFQTELLPLRDDPNRQVRLNALWATLEHEGIPPHREAELQEWLGFNSDDVVGRLNLAQEAFRRGRMDDLVAWTEAMVSLDDSAGPNLMAGRLLHAAGRSGEAAVKLERVVASDPANTEGWFVLGLFRGEQGELDAALSALQRVVELDPGHGRAWYNLGLLQIQRGARSAGLNALTQAERHSPGSPDPAYAAATVYAQTGDLRAAHAALQRALSQAPQHPPSLRMLRQLPPMPTPLP